jgi:hypothetical protein
LLLLPRERHSILRHERWRDYLNLVLRPAEDSRDALERQTATPEAYKRLPRA